MKRIVGTLTGCLVAAVLLGSCVGEPTGPGARVGALAIAPRYANLMANAIVDVSAIRIQLLEPETNATVVDTTVAFPVGVDSVAIRLTVPLETGLDFLLVLAMTDAAGDTVFRAGPIPVRVSSSPFAVRVAEPLLTYVGTGANATAVRFVNPPLALTFGATATLLAEALDAQGTVIPGTPIGFELVNPADSTRLSITDERAGTIVARSLRGIVPVRAVLATGQTAQHAIAVQPVAQNVIAQSGSAQTGTVGLALAQPLVARVRAADGLGVQGVPVNFEVLTGGGSLSRLVDTTDANGDARSTLTLGAAPGVQTARAVVPSLGGATASFSATAVVGAATQLVFGVQPVSTTSGAVLAPAVTVRARDALGNDVTSFTGNVTIALLNNPSGAVLGGTLTRAAVAGVATFNDLALAGLGTGITMRATSGALGAATSAAFNITIGAPAALTFTVQPPATSPGSPFIVAVAARDAGGNIVPTFTLPVSVAIGTNPAGGTLSGVTTVNAVGGVATFAGLAIDNVGTGYTLSATRAGLTTATSVPFNVAVGAGINAWVNAAGGNWSTPGNWSLGTVPTAADTVWIRQSGTYSVNVDVAATVGRMLVGGTSGTQTLNVNTGTLTMNDSVLVNANGAVVVAGGGIAGTGAMAVASAFTWNGGDLSGTGARVRVLAGGSLTIGGTATRTFNNFVLENAGTGSWTGAHTINSGSGATLRVFAGATLNISGDPLWFFNQGGPPVAFDVQGALSRTTSAGTALVTGLALSGSLNLTSGDFETRDAGTSSGSFTAGAGTILRFASGTQVLTAAATVQGAGTVLIGGSGGVTNAGTWNVTGTTRLSPGGTLTQNAAGSTGVLDLVGGVRAGTGTLTVTGSMAWSSGDLNGGGGLTRVAVGAPLTISGTATRTLNAQTLEVAGTAAWFGTHTVNTGSAGTLRIAATGTLDIQGDPTFVYSQGGPATLFQNLGTVTRSVSAGLVVLNAPVTNAGSFAVQTGIVELRGGGTLGGTFTVTSPSLLRFPAGTFTMQPGLSVAGTGSASLEGATLAGLAANDTVQFNTLALQSGALNPGTGGVVRVNTLLDWSGAAALGGGGTTRVMPAATLSINGATTRQLNNHTIANEGTASWTGAATINSGSSARIRNSGTFTWAGDGSYLFNQGGGLSVFENLGVFQRTGTGVAQLGAQLIDTLGTSFTLAAGELRAGNGGRIGGNKALTGGIFELGGGTLSMRSGMLWSGTGGYVRVTAGTLTLDSAVTVTMPRLDLSGGLLAHEGLVDVITAMNWSGGDITSNTVGGGGTTRVRAGGLMTISGAGARTLSGTHLLQLLGNTNFTATGSINAGSGAVIANSGLFDLQGSGSILYNQGGAATTFQNLAGATLRSSGATTGQISFPVQNLGALSVTGDSLWLSGGSVSNFSGTATISSGALFLAGGVFTLTGPLTTVGANAHLTVGGTLNLAGFTATVGGNFATTGAGVFQQSVATSQLNVTGSVTVAGGASTVTAGQLQVAGSFTQAGAANAFVASGTHRTVLSGTGTQNISFAGAPTSRFNRLDIVDITRNVVIQSNVFVADTLLMRGGSGASNLIGSGTTQRLTANGALVMIWSTVSPRLAPPVLEINATPAVGPIGTGGGIQADTTVFIGGNVNALPVGAGYNYRSVRIAGTASFSLPSDTIIGDLHVASTLGFFPGSTTFRVGGKLRVDGTGQLAIFSTDVNVTVVDSTIFAGGTTNGALTAGTLHALGDFVQSGGDPAAFAATGSFRVRLAGTGLQRVRFVNPDSIATSSHFADLEIANSSAAGVQFQSPVFAINQLRSQPGRPAISRVAGSSATPLTIAGILADSITFDGVPLRISGAAALTNMSVFTFQNMNPAVDQFIIRRAGIVPTFFPNQVVFSTVPNAGVNYLVLQNTSSAGLAMAVTFFNSSPVAGSMTGRYLKQSLPGPLPVLVWNGVTLP